MNVINSDPIIFVLVCRPFNFEQFSMQKKNPLSSSLSVVIDGQTGGPARARLGPACIGPAMLAGRAVPAHVPPYRPRPGLVLAYAGRACPTARVLGWSGRPVAH
jgi:hypothetical protein